MTLILDFQGQFFDSHILGMVRSIDMEVSNLLAHEWANRYSFTDLGAEGVVVLWTPCFTYFLISPLVLSHPWFF